MFLKIMGLLLAFSFSLAQAASSDFDKQMSDSALTIKSVNDRIADLQAKIDRCKGIEVDKYAAAGATVGCEGFLNFANRKDYDGWKTELAQQQQKLKSLKADVDTSKAAKNLSDISKMEINGKAIDIQLLLADAKSAEASLKSAGVDIQALNAKFDQSVLGEYSKYAIQNALKSAAGQKMICSAVTTCSDTKKMSASLGDVDKRMKSFEQFRNEQVELLRKSVMSNGAGTNSSSGTAGGGSTK